MKGLLVALFVGLVLLTACGAPASPAPVLTPTPTPTPITPSPAPTPTPNSPVGQTEQDIEDGWVRLIVAGVGSIDYPTDFLELQSQDYRDMGKGIYQLLQGKSDFTLQQAGLNEWKPSAFSEYRRVMLTTVYLDRGEETFRAGEKYTLSQEELAELKNDFASDGSLQIVEVNGMYPLLHTYERQLSDNPIVSVKHYVFWNYDRVHHLILSYRVMDEDKSRDIYGKILSSFRLQK